MRIASYGDAHADDRAGEAPAAPTRRSPACTASISAHVCHSHQLSASMSSSRGARPARAAAAAICTQIAGPKAAVKRSSIAGSHHGGRTSSTSWPSPSSSAAASRAARSQSGSSVTPAIGACVVTPIRSRPGSRAAASANGSARRRRPRRVARLGAGEDVEQQRRLAHRARQDAVADEEVLAGVRRGRDAAALGLQADEAAARGRDAQRAAAVVAVGERHHRRRDGGRRAARRAARRALEVPRVARRPAAARLGHRQDAPLGQRRRADDDEPGRAQPRDDVVVVARA